MKIEKIEVNPMVGCNLFNFGASAEEVMAAIGEPTEVEEYTDEDDSFEGNSAIWFYDELGLTLFMDESEDGTMMLSGMESDFDKTIILGKNAIGMSEKDLLSFVKDKNFGEMECEDEDWGESRISFEEKLLDFYLDESKKVVSVSWGME